MEMMSLTTERLFQSGEFELVHRRLIYNAHRLEIFPNQVYVTNGGRKGLTVVGTCFQSQNGNEFGLSANMQQIIRQLEKDDHILKGYIAYAVGEGRNNDNPKLINWITAQQQERLLSGISPTTGKYGPFWWVNEEGIVSRRIQEAMMNDQGGRSSRFTEVPWNH